MDRGYLDFARLGRFNQMGAFFVIRGKTNLKFYVVESRPVDPACGLRCDQTIRLRGFYSKQGYPQSLRRFFPPAWGWSANSTPLELPLTVLPTCVGMVRDQ